MAALAGRLLAALACVATATAAGAQPAPTRLSAWLLENVKGDSYLAGTSWLVPEEMPAQRALKDDLLRELAARSAPVQLRDWIGSLPVTGRVPVDFADPRWLLAHPERDPILAPGQQFALPPRPATVTVITDDGARCAVTHAAGREALAYLEACSAKKADWAWVVQPDGRVERYGVASWNREAQDEPAPGAWIWAPARARRYPERLSERLAQFLATQGPAPDPTSNALTLAPTFSKRSQSVQYHANDFGETGVLQTPSARIRPAGTITLHASHTWPYTRVNVFASPFDWLEGGFRYTDISNRLYGTPDLSGNQTFKDKSVDVKLRVWKESAYVPAMAVEMRDIGGTGLFSSEHVVASKRFGDFDLSAGLAWGYAAGRGDTRRSTDPNGGNFNYQDYFSGKPAPFGGVVYQTPWRPLMLMVEREANDYRHEPLGLTLPQRTPWNFGLSYRIHPSLELTVAAERGNRLMVGLAFSSNLADTYMPKVSDPPRVPYTVPAEREPDWRSTAAEISRQTGWRIGRIERSGRELRVTVLDAQSTYWVQRADRAAAVLNRDAPASVDRFVFVQEQGGIEMAEHVVDRTAWATKETRPLAPHEKQELVTARAPQPPAPRSEVLAQKRPRLEHGLGPDVSYTFGSPDAFVLYQISVAERARLWLGDSTWARGTAKLALIDNYDRFHFTAPSDLPRVRTYVREYQTTSRLMMPNLQLTHVERFGRQVYASAYAGYFEEMFGGVGTEWLYRPFESRAAFGVDLNYVRQRDFDQHFGFMDYTVTTGHATAYLDTGWNDVLVTASAGRYLAGDWGGTLQLSRVFRNGVSMGAFATRTNAGARFGEGSFDKGVVVTIPFDALFTRSTDSAGVLAWRPLTRDGGARLRHADSLYGLTSTRDGRTTWYRPAEPK